jgi:hypothetical protein
LAGCSACSWQPGLIRQMVGYPSAVGNGLWGVLTLQRHGSCKRCDEDAVSSQVCCQLLMPTLSIQAGTCNIHQPHMSLCLARPTLFVFTMPVTLLLHAAAHLGFRCSSHAVCVHTLAATHGVGLEIAHTLSVTYCVQFQHHPTPPPPSEYLAVAACLQFQYLTQWFPVFNFNTTSGHSLEQLLRVFGFSITPPHPHHTKLISYFSTCCRHLAQFSSMEAELLPEVPRGM